MRTSWFLFAAAAIVAVNFNAVFAASDVDQENLVSTDSVTPSNGHVKRFLRADKSGKDDEERVAPGTGLLDFTKTASWKTLDNVATDIAAIPGSSKFVKHIQNELDWTMIKIANLKLTPEDLEMKLNIAVKRATMSDEQLNLDPGYLLWKNYNEFWNARKGPA